MLHVFVSVGRTLETNVSMQRLSYFHLSTVETMSYQRGQGQKYIKHFGNNLKVWLRYRGIFWHKMYFYCAKIIPHAYIFGSLNLQLRKLQQRPRGPMTYHIMVMKTRSKLDGIFWCAFEERPRRFEWKHLHDQLSSKSCILSITTPVDTFQLRSFFIAVKASALFHFSQQVARRMMHDVWWVWVFQGCFFFFFICFIHPNISRRHISRSICMLVSLDSINWLNGFWNFWSWALFIK